MRYKGPRLGGVIGLSGLMGLEKPYDNLTIEDEEKIAQTPIFLYIGDKDHFFHPEKKRVSLLGLKEIYN